MDADFLQIVIYIRNGQVFFPAEFFYAPVPIGGGAISQFADERAHHNPQKRCDGDRDSVQGARLNPYPPEGQKQHDNQMENV